MKQNAVALVAGLSSSHLLYLNQKAFMRRLDSPLIYFSHGFTHSRVDSLAITWSHLQILHLCLAQHPLDTSSLNNLQAQQ